LREEKSFSQRAFSIYYGQKQNGDMAYAKVVLVTSVETICKICKKSLVKEEEAKV